MASTVTSEFGLVASRTVHSHTISRFYLNKFADPRKRLWAYRKGSSPTICSTKRSTTEKYFYEYDFKGERTGNRFENFFQKLESNAAKVYPSILGRMNLSDSEKVAWALFVSSLFLRTKKWRQEMVESQIKTFLDEFASEESIRAMQYNLTLRGQFRQLDEIRAVVRNYADEVQKQPSYLHLNRLPDSILKLATSLLSKSWHVIEACPGMQYCSSDAPVSSFRLDHRGAVFSGHGFGKFDVVAVLPVSPNKTWFASPVGVEWPRSFDERDTELFNRLTVSFAQDRVFAHDRRDDLDQIAQNELGDTVFGLTAFVRPS